MRHPRVFRFLLVAFVLSVPGLPAAAQNPVPLPPTLIDPPPGYNAYPTGVKIQKVYINTHYYASTVLSEGPIRVPGIHAPVFEIVVLWRPVNVYTPPGYDPSNQSYPVLYLLHGRLGTYSDWKDLGEVQPILDNLVDQKKMAPTIVVMPENYCSVEFDDSEQTDSEVTMGYTQFEQELIDDLVPWVDANFATISGAIAAFWPESSYLGARYRALAGLSMGADQALNFGWKHQDTFGFIAGFSPGDELFSTDDIIPISKVPLEPTFGGAWITCGNKDLKILGSTNNELTVYDELEAYQPIHEFSTFNTLSGMHEWPVWKHSLYYYVQTLQW
jgi:enterochelin esterase-like enzyme